MQMIVTLLPQQLLLQPQQQLPQTELLPDYFSHWLKLIPSLGHLQVEQGLDWLQIRFYFRDAAFALHYEHYSDSCWVEADNAAGAVLLSELASLMQNNNA